MGASYDAIVIGGGHNGLVSAAYLARAGKKVLVLERRHVLGGSAVTEEVFPGVIYNGDLPPFLMDDVANTLKDKAVTVRGKVVKFLPEIMGRNWIQISSHTDHAGAC